MSEQEEKAEFEELHDFLTEQLGTDWRKGLKLTVRADTLYWFVFLIERGIEERRQHYRSKGRVDASEAASLASWRFDLAVLLDQAKEVVKKLKKK